MKTVIRFLNSLWALFVAFAFLFALAVAAIFCYKQALGIYTIEHRLDKIEYRLEHMEAK